MLLLVHLVQAQEKTESNLKDLGLDWQPIFCMSILPKAHHHLLCRLLPTGKRAPTLDFL